jgi:hypothetical protein
MEFCATSNGVREDIVFVRLTVNHFGVGHALLNTASLKPYRSLTLTPKCLTDDGTTKEPAQNARQG